MIAKILDTRMEIQIVIALLSATFVGVYFPGVAPSFAWMGEMFLKLLQLFIMPLLLFSMMLAILGLLNIEKLKKLGGITVFYYMLTTFVAILLSLLLMNIIAPGIGVNIGTYDFDSTQVASLSFQQFMMDIIPDNFFRAFLDGNAMQIVVMGAILGIAILVSGVSEKIKTTIDILETLNNGILEFIKLVIKFTAFGVFAIVVNIIAENGIDSVLGLWEFVATILSALFIHAVILLPLLAMVFIKVNTKKIVNPYKYFMKIKEAIMLGFSTASSSASLGMTMSVAMDETKGNIKKAIVEFVAPIGATINMDGTALYQAGVALFVAQALGIDLSLTTQLTIVVVVILASIGASGIPGAGIITLTVVFSTIGLPVEAIGVILAVDRILDMFRTALNVWGDLLTNLVVHHYNEHLEQKRS